MYSDFKTENVESIMGLLRVEFDPFKDDRGLLFTTFLKGKFNTLFPGLDFVHDKFAANTAKGTLRGIHGDDKSWKLVSILHGSAYQVVVDRRKESSTFGKVYDCILSADKPTALLLPPGCGNGFQTLEHNTLYHYKLAYSGQYNDAENQFTIPWDSDTLNINWPIKNPILSKRDRNARD
uniref:dTDP-4-dehydrorhamnose 3,5-epimerase family protein n=1 Tax=Algoriphagus sp. TaxID=1872435 RepID=UPI004048A433